MSFNYDSSLRTDKDRVRFLLQDTNSSKQMLQDEEIIWLISTEANVWMAAARCADMLVSRFRGASSKSVGGLSISYGSEQWAKVASNLRMRGMTHQVISAGGILKDDRDAIWEDSTLLKPAFWDEIHHDPTSLTPGRSSDLSDEES